MDKMSNLLIFHDIMEDNVIRKYNEAIIKKSEECWQEFHYEIIKKAEKIGLSGNVFSSYIVYLLAKGNNIVADNIQHNAVVGNSLSILLEDEMQRIMPYIESMLPADKKINTVLNDYIPGQKCSMEGYNELIAKLAAVNSAQEAAQTLIAHYKKYGSGQMVHYRAFCWSNDNKLKGINHFEKIRMTDLIGYAKQKKQLVDNTLTFIEGKPYNNILLVGSRGTGKSSGVKALANEYYKKGLRLLQITKDQIKLLPDIMEHLRSLAGYKFIIFLDDLSFDQEERDYKYLKSVIEGGVASRPENVVLYATSNRRHLIKETWNDREDTQEELYRNDSVNESISLSDRFGIIINYDAPNQDEYLAIIDSYLQKEGISLSAEQLRVEGLRWELTHSGRNGRVAKQFVNWYLGQNK